MNQPMKILKKVLEYHRAIIILLTPTLLIPLLVSNTKEGKMAFILILMAIYWATEVLPLATTSLLPLVLVPVFGILPASKIGPSYLSDTCVLFLGAIMVALSFEHHNLHKKVALFVLSYVGSDPRLLMIGFMVPTWFLSMWINNTSATAMMIPIVEAVLIELRANINACSSHDVFDNEVQYNNLNVEDSALNEGNVPENQDQVEIKVTNLDTFEVTSQDLYREELKSVEKGFYLCIAYSASCGGVATMTGTPPNFVLYGMLYEYFGTTGGLNFGTWMLVNLPISFILLCATWFWLALLFIGPRKVFIFKRNLERDVTIKKFIEFEKRKLGQINFAQGWCIFFFGLLVILWITKTLGPTGWSKLFVINKVKYVKDSTPAMMIAILLMVWPATNPFSKNIIDDKNAEKVIMPWKVMQKNFPWGVLFLIGGGLALAQSCKASGLTDLLAKKMEFLNGINVILIVIILTTITSFVTELTSNTATSSVLLPIFLKLAACMKVNPLLLSLPVTLSCSMAFCLPVATPPNTIVFTKDAIRVIDMIKAGFVLNILSVIIINLATFTYVNAYFNLFEVPSWAGECQQNKSSSALPK